MVHDMNTYKFLSVPDHQKISDCMYEYIVHHTDILKRPKFWYWLYDIPHVLEHNPDLKDYVASLKLTPAWIGVITVTETQPEILHIDGDPGVRILWPIKNCAGTQTRFYNVDESLLEIQDLDHQAKYKLVTDPGPHEIIDQFELTSPVAFNPGIVHSVHVSTSTEFPRLSFAMGFDCQDDRVRSVHAW
jgi:hypothetical protein